MCCDVAVTLPFADSYVDKAASEADAAAEKIRKELTRMVQLPATAGIEYVAAPGVGLFPRGYFARGHFWPGGLLAGGAFVRGVFCPGDFCPGGLCPSPPQVQCVYESSRLSVPSIVA